MCTSTSVLDGADVYGTLPASQRVLLDSATIHNQILFFEAKIINKSLLLPGFKIQVVQKGIKWKASLSLLFPATEFPSPEGTTKRFSVLCFSSTILYTYVNTKAHTSFFYPFNTNHNIHIVLHLAFLYFLRKL